MQTRLNHTTPTEDSAVNGPKFVKAVEKLDFIEKEVDMGFFDQHSFEVKDGIVLNTGCQRIKKCSCNCNDCGVLVFL